MDGGIRLDEQHLQPRLDQAEDRNLLRHDLLTNAEKLRNPTGLSRELTTVHKKLALSGSLHSAQWDEPEVTHLLTTGWPVLFLPHTATILRGQDLFRLTLRAIVIGVFSLAYHGWGFDAGCPRAMVAAMLDHIRSHGPLNRRGLPAEDVAGHNSAAFRI